MTPQQKWKLDEAVQAWAEYVRTRSQFETARAAWHKARDAAKAAGVTEEVLLAAWGEADMRTALETNV